MSQEKKLMALLGVTYEEAIDIIAKDREIDKGGDPFPLTPAEAKASKEARQASGDKTARKTTTRTKKVDADKQEIIQAIDEAICRIADRPSEIITPEREILFQFNGRKFKITLSAPRA